MATQQYTGLRAMANSLNHYEASDSFEQRASRLKYAAQNAKRRGDTAALAALKAAWEALKAEWDAALVQENAAELVQAAREDGDLATVNAVNKAALFAAQGVRPVPTHVNGTYLVRGSQGTVYRASASRCNCKAGATSTQCWHVALVRIVGGR